MASTPTPTLPPKAPNPSGDNHLAENERAYLGDSSEGKLVMEDEDWDLSSATALSAVKLLIAAVQALAEATGHIPPTPPASRPVTPAASKVISGATLSPALTHSGPGTPMSPISPLSRSSMASVLPVTLPSPEAHRDEPLPEVEPATPQAMVVQQAAIARRFFLKSVPGFSLSQYLLRIHHYCPHSPGVYLVAASYIQRLCVDEALVPATEKTIHRLCLTAIRVASKAFEDHKWSQDRFAKVGGLSRRELKSLEINLCFLLDFELFVREADLKKRVFALQQAAMQGATVRRRLSGRFRMELPVRVLKREATGSSGG